MPKTRMFVKHLLIGLVVCLLLAPSAALAESNPIQASLIRVVNQCNNDMMFRYTAYSETPWEHKGCPTQDNKILSPGGADGETYNYTTSKPCNKIYITASRVDRATDLCRRSIKAEFAPATPKILSIQGNCAGNNCDFHITPVGGNKID